LKKDQPLTAKHFEDFQEKNRDFSDIINIDKHAYSLEPLSKNHYKEQEMLHMNRAFSFNDYN